MTHFQEMRMDMEKTAKLFGKKKEPTEMDTLIAQRDEAIKGLRSGTEEIQRLNPAATRSKTPRPAPEVQAAPKPAPKPTPIRREESDIKSKQPPKPTPVPQAKPTPMPTPIPQAAPVGSRVANRAAPKMGKGKIALLAGGAALATGGAKMGYDKWQEQKTAADYQNEIEKKASVYINGLYKIAEEEEEKQHGGGHGLATGLGIAGAMHVAPNVGMKIVKSTNAGHRALAATLAAGVKHGETGRMVHPNVRSLLEYGIGPETMVDYNVGQKIGQRLKKYEDNPERQEVYKQRLQKMVNDKGLDPAAKAEVSHLPVVGSVKRYLDGDTSPRMEKAFDRVSVPAADKLTKAQMGMNGAMLAGAGAVDPHILMQPAFAGSRKLLAKSKLGKDMMERNFSNGLDGKKISKGKELLIDTMVSPSILDPHRIGSFAGKNAQPGDVAKLKAMYKANDMGPDSFDPKNFDMNKLKGAINSVQPKPPTFGG